MIIKDGLFLFQIHAFRIDKLCFPLFWPCKIDFHYDYKSFFYLIKTQLQCYFMVFGLFFRFVSVWLSY
jgi:hypothetical protein